MSLRETIDAARHEAEEGGGLFFGKDKEETPEEKPESTGFSRRSTAKAKPTRNAAAGVRVVSAEDAKAGRSGKKSSEMTKEERKAERERQRDMDDLRNMAANILIKKDPDYRRTQVVWWVMLGIGFACTLISFTINWILSKDNAGVTTEQAQMLVPVAMVSLVLAYVFIIGGFVYDMFKARPIRVKYDGVVKGMSRKKLEQVIQQDAEERAAKKDAKK